MRPDEKAFEEHVTRDLVERGGYQTVKIGNANRHFDPARGLDLAELFTFIHATQADAWDNLVARRGDEAKARAGFTDRLVREIDARGTVEVLRHGIVDLGVTMRLAYFKPAYGLNPDLVAKYEANRLTVTRQLPFETTGNKSLDLTLLVNGLPVATAELKNALTGQNVEHAREQYRRDRDPANVTLGRRAVVHFAVDTEEVAMTTRLSGAATRFLPFNQGNGLGKGNPPNPEGHRTAYLWEKVWAKDAWMDLLGRFVHVEGSGAGSARGSRRGSGSEGTIIFPRYHQWSAALALSAHARDNGAGESYLVQHSAGSGKSNTIAWLAHRLSNLHDAHDQKVFDKVIVITDRVILDRQLQDTIHGFEHASGVVQKIDGSSTQLAEALSGQSARIIITTLQKFPFVLDKVADLSGRSYAVIVDEAHSSQTGESAKDLRKALGTGPEPFTEAETTNPAEDALAREVAARGRQRNISYFAFTATPKGRTLELFGREDPSSGRRVAAHTYSMRQAIEEGFIHDVLANYVTYTAFWNIEKTVEEDPEYDASRAGAAIARFVTLHEHNLSQKAEVIVEHFRRHVAHRIAGRARAMVVTSSRAHAVRMTRALRKYVSEHGYDGPGILVAFSGTVEDEGVSYTEASMNGFPEGRTPIEFERDEWRFLVVAEKYQTGFDQPLLYAMYVDKVLTGLAAVQTLSRLNRRTEGKDGTFVLDFRNDAEAVRAEFEPYHGRTEAPPTDPNMLYDARAALEDSGVFVPEEVQTVAELLLAGTGPRVHARLHAALAPAVERFRELPEEGRDEFRDALERFVRYYSFLSQVIGFGDTGLERDFRFARALRSFIGREGGSGALDLGTTVELTHLQLERTFEGSLSVPGADAPGLVRSLGADEIGRSEAESRPLSRIVEHLNERFGTTFTEADRIHLDAVAQDLVGSETVQRQAAANSLGNFGVGFSEHFQAAVVDRLRSAEDFSYRLLDDREMSEEVMEAYLPLVYARARVAWQASCPVGELLGPPPKSGEHLEYQSVFGTPTIAAVASFLNSSEGGTLLIGVAADGSVSGLDEDYATLADEDLADENLGDERDQRPGFALRLERAVVAAVGSEAAKSVGVGMLEVGGRDLCRVHVGPSALPVEAEVPSEDGGTLFYGRFADGVRTIDDPEERERYKARIWGR